MVAATDMTGGPVTELVGRAAAGALSRPALSGCDVEYSYEELLERVRLRAQWLFDSGAVAGSRVAVSARNHPEVVVLFLATMQIGAVWVGIAPALPPAEKLARVTDARATLFLVDASQGEGLRAGLRALELPDSPALVEFGPDDALGPAPGRGSGSTAAASLLARQPAAIAYTSGSTGRPKGVVHCQEAIATAVEALGTLYPPGARHGACLALTTLNMLMASALVALATGGSCAVTDDRAPKALAGWIRRERVETFPAVPTLLYDLVEDPDVDPADLRSLVRPGLGGGAVDPELVRRFTERFGHMPSVGYGLSEAPCTIARRLPAHEAPAASVGPPLPHVTITIRDPGGGIVPAGSTGEICIGPVTTGPWAHRYVSMLGYWAQPTLSEHALRGGVLHTGDIGHLDEAGNLYVGGRMDQTIKRAGSNVPAGRVESVVERHPAVHACVAVGIPDARVGERIVVVFEPEPGRTVTSSELAAFAEKALAPFERPDRFVENARLPRTSTEKFARDQVREQLQQAPAGGGG